MDRTSLLEHYRTTRATSLKLCAPLRAEDYRIQSMPDVSPPWWNLGHTTWFFARNVLEPHGRYTGADRRLEYVLNSYYESLGERLPRARRGLVTRPTTDEVLDFRQSVDERLEALIAEVPEAELAQLAFLVRTGIEHEQQHQELLVTEVKHILGSNPRPLRAPYRTAPPPDSGSVPPLELVPFSGGVCEIGNLEGGWCWDNELPVHKTYLDDFFLASRLVTNGEFRAFIADGGYRTPLLWLSNGWAQAKEQGWQAPLYWQEEGDGWQLWTLWGDRPLDPDEPVCHLSFYEADAFARWLSQQGTRWAGTRLPTEREWEHAARTDGFGAAVAAGNLLDGERLHPRPAAASGAGRLRQTAGDLWEWTTSHYEPYPRYRPFDGNLMEYNGKFMDNQRVLRGGSCATPASHIRVSYRNFWPADTRFQLTGLRLAADGD